MNLDERIKTETDPSQKYWLKQARMHLRASQTHKDKYLEILRKLNTYKPGESVSTSV